MENMRHFLKENVSMNTSVNNGTIKFLLSVYLSRLGPINIYKSVINLFLIRFPVITAVQKIHPCWLLLFDILIIKFDFAIEVNNRFTADSVVFKSMSIRCSRRRVRGQRLDMACATVWTGGGVHNHQLFERNLLSKYMRNSSLVFKRLKRAKGNPENRPRTGKLDVSVLWQDGALRQNWLWDEPRKVQIPSLWRVDGDVSVGKISDLWPWMQNRTSVLTQEDVTFMGH